MANTPRSGATDAEAEVPLGPAPLVQGRDKIRAGIRAKLFGEGDPSTQDTALGDVPIRRRPDSEDPERIGRFKVLKRLGAGGMGVVYSAYDPELDRKVAIKLLRPDLVRGTGTQGTSRLQREAQAMARLNHPNVATVHEVGTHDEQVFVAMEFVDGGTLREWLEPDCPWREVLDKCIDAGAGLAAAHAAGIVHRDFKPDNVMIDKSGRVRVMDFGLSRAREEDTVEKPPDASAVLPRDVDPMQTPLTATGALMGTPAYMAPEQHQGRAADERSDQFAYCVAVWEALCGERPFEGKTYPTLVANVLAGKVRTLPTGVKAGRRVIAVLERGLAVEPSARHPSMDALLHELRADPARWWRRGGVAFALMGVASVATAVAVRDGAVSPDACADEPTRMVGVWDDERADAVHKALLATGKDFAEPVWLSTRRLLDRYASDWTSAASELCAARLVAASPDAVGYQRRAHCLDARLAELDQLAGLLARNDEGLAMQAVQAAATLSEVAGCSDAQQLQAWSIRRDEASIAEQAQAREKLGLAKAEGALGRYDAAIGLAADVVRHARGLDDPGLEASGLLVQGQFLERAGKIELGETALRDAVRQAEVAGDHVTRALALIRLVYVVGAEAKRVNEARALGADASAVLRVIGADKLLAAKLETNLGAVAKAAREWQTALKHYRAALDAHLELFGPDHPESIRAFANIGSPLSRLRRWDEAELYLLQALEGFEKTLGAEHPHVGVVLNNLGNNKARAHRYKEAIPYLRRALALREKVLGPSHNRVASTRYNLGTALFNVEAYEEAKVVLSASIAGLKLSNPNDPRMPTYQVHLGIAQLMTEEIAPGRRNLAEAIRQYRNAGDRETSQARSAHFQLAASLLVDDPKESRRLAEIGLEMALDSAQEGKGFEADIAKFRSVLWLLDSIELLATPPAQK